jgi:hypothetical protein
MSEKWLKEGTGDNRVAKRRRIALAKGHVGKADGDAVLCERCGHIKPANGWTKKCRGARKEAG